jgi:molecular chaperone GrpE (heat shock protein)
MKEGIRQFLLKLIITLAVISVLLATAFYYRAPLQAFLQPYIDRFLRNLNYQLEASAPCQKPITFSLGAIDPKFKLSNTQIIAAINEASGIWSKPLDKQLFAHATTSGSLTINFVYDYRQETTDKLKSLGIVVETNQKSYEELKARYDALNAQYQAEKSELQQLSAEFERQQSAYKKEVERWNKRGGAPKDVFDVMNQTAIALNNKLEEINAKTAEVNALVESLNAEGDMLNRLIADLNLNVDKYNTTGGATGKEFQEGVYIQDEDGRRIEVYEFGDRAQLIRLLAHELGHALGLDHSSGATDIMYYLNEAGNDQLTANDLSALRARCKVE